MAVMITSNDLSQETHATDMLTAIRSSLNHSRRHALRLLRLYGDQALEVYVIKYTHYFL